MDEVKVTYGNKAYSFPRGISLLEVSKNFGENYKYDILAGKVNSDIMPLDYVINEDCSLDFFDLSSFVGNKMYERSTILILAKAVKDVMKAEVRVEHSIDRGIYCIIDNLSKEKVSLILNRMREIV